MRLTSTSSTAGPISADSRSTGGTVNEMRSLVVAMQSCRDEPRLIDQVCLEPVTQLVFRFENRLFLGLAFGYPVLGSGLTLC